MHVKRPVSQGAAASGRRTPRIKAAFCSIARHERRVTPMGVSWLSVLPLWVTASNWWLLVLSTLVALAGLEVALQTRQMLFERTIAAEQERTAMAQAATLRLHRQSPDPVLKYEIRPGAVVERDGVLYRINAQGLRDDEDVSPKQAGERRIVILGDSVAFGLGVDQERTF